MDEEAGRARAGAPSRTSPAARTARCPNLASSRGMASSPASSPLVDPLAALDPEAWRALAGDLDQALAG